MCVYGCMCWRESECERVHAPSSGGTTHCSQPCEGDEGPPHHRLARAPRIQGVAPAKAALVPSPRQRCGVLLEGGGELKQSRPQLARGSAEGGALVGGRTALIERVPTEQEREGKGESEVRGGDRREPASRVQGGYQTHHARNSPVATRRALSIVIAAALAATSRLLSNPFQRSTQRWD